jgi:hypothetical protein
MEEGLSCGDQASIEQLIRLLENPELKVRAEARDRLCARATEAIPKLLVAIEVGSEEVRFEISKALMEMGQAAVEPMMKAILHPNVHVRETAARVLSLIGGPDASQRLDEAARAEKRKTVRKELREASAKIVRRLESQEARHRGQRAETVGMVPGESDLRPKEREEKRLYMSIVRSRIVSNWARPRLFSGVVGGEEVLVTLKVEPDGTVSRVLIENKWQNTPLGESLKDAIRRSSPLPAVPDVVARGRDEVDLTFILEALR